ncbi:class I SAM-dependent methyltransferase [Amylibacter sp.]|nr:class I SAM-dependent methyltransferase [Amylibacter sp.]
MVSYKKHFDNLKTFYLEKGLSAEDTQFYALEKVKKLKISDDPFSYNSWLSNLIPYLKRETGVKSEEFLILDFGCGSGEMVILMRSLGFKAYGYDIYDAEIDLANELAKDNGYHETLFFSEKEKVLEHIGDKKINVLASFSVLEHLSDQYFLDKIDDFYDYVDGCIFALVPSKYKILDDHTGLKFLGLFPRLISQMFVSITRNQYKLSESGDWDVWYRSIKDFQNLSASRGMDLTLVDHSVMYPSLKEVAKIGQSRRLSLGSFVEMFYARAIKLFTRNEDNLYPYLNFTLKKRK